MSIQTNLKRTVIEEFKCRVCNIIYLVETIAVGRIYHPKWDMVKWKNKCCKENVRSYHGE